MSGERQYLAKVLAENEMLKSQSTVGGNSSSQVQRGSDEPNATKIPIMMWIALAIGYVSHQTLCYPFLLIISIVVILSQLGIWDMVI